MWGEGYSPEDFERLRNAFLAVARHEIPAIGALMNYAAPSVKPRASNISAAVLSGEKLCSAVSQRDGSRPPAKRISIAFVAAH